MAPCWRHGGGRTWPWSLTGVAFEKTLLLVLLSLSLLMYLVEHNYLLVHSNRGKASEGSWGFGPRSSFTHSSDAHKSITERIDDYDEELAIGSAQYTEEQFEIIRSQANQQENGNHEYHIKRQNAVRKRDSTTEKEPVIIKPHTYGKDRVIQETHSEGQVSHRLPYENGARTVKIIELHTPLYNDESWQKRLRGAFDLRQCPETRCKFVFYPDRHPNPDALVFHAPHIRKDTFPATLPPEQIYILMSLEATGLHPQNGGMAKLLREGKGDSLFFDWTMTFHRHSDVQLTYGHFRSLKGETLGLRPGLLDPTSSTLSGYIEALQQHDLRKEAEPNAQLEMLWWRPKMVAWLVSHCNTESGSLLIA